MLPRWVKVSLIVGAIAVAGSIVLVSMLKKQDWSQYTSDLTSGVIVGSLVAVIVGYILWQWQTNAESTTRARDAEEVWKIIREMVRADLDGPWDLSVTGTDAWDHDWRHVQKLFSETLLEQVPRWAIDAPKNEELTLTRDLLRQGAVVKRKASRLNFQIGFAVAETRLSSSFENDITHAAWMVLRGNSDSVDGPDLVLEAAERALTKPEVDIAVDDYLAAVRHLHDLYDKLWSRLEPRSDPQ